MSECETSTIRVLIVDDHGMVRFGLRGYIETMPCLKVVGEAGSGEEALQVLETTEADIILMDLVLPGMSGADATRLIAERYPAVRVIIMTSFIDSAHVLPAIRAGAAGYLLKDILPDDLAKAMVAIYKGQSVMHPKVIAQIAANLAPANQSEIDLVNSLSERELDVLRLLTRGLQNHEIAVELSVSENTVRTHVSNLLTKLDLRDRTQAALFGVRFFDYIA
ncbi:MAG: response regulator transcription factor [Chloroflexi bacterium]|nr:response regulator transcription factor [Chloroflexota bacterium]